MPAATATWLDARTARAPELLKQRLTQILAMTGAASPRVVTLAAAGATALEAAIAAGEDRRAALDLLAADGLITLAMLAAAECSPETLAATARALRLGTP